MIVINLFAGPGAGKSTTAAGVFHVLKSRGHNAELVGEFAKDLVWEDRTDTLRNQLYILGKQYHRIHRLRNNVDVAIVDSPLLLCKVYTAHHHMTGDQGPFERLNDSIMRASRAAHDTFRNVNVFVSRVKPYNPKGRTQDEGGARQLDDEVREMLEGEGVPYYTFPGSPGTPELIADLYEKDLS